MSRGRVGSHGFPQLASTWELRAPAEPRGDIWAAAAPLPPESFPTPEPCTRGEAVHVVGDLSETEVRHPVVLSGTFVCLWWDAAASSLS